MFSYQRKSQRRKREEKGGKGRKREEEGKLSRDRGFKTFI